MKKQKLFIIILSYNTRSVLQRCLESLVKICVSRKSFAVNLVLVDNGSTDGSKEYLKNLEIRNPKSETTNSKSPIIKDKDKRQQKINIKVIFNKDNLGFAAGNNVGIKYALAEKAHYIMLLNSDVVVNDQFWLPLIRFLREEKQVGVVGPKIYFAPGYEFHKDRYRPSELGKVIWYAGGEIDWDNVMGCHDGVDEVDRGQHNCPLRTDFVTGCCLLARSKVFSQTGGLDEKYFMYFEDIDFCLQAKKLGWESFYVPDAAIWHLNAGSSGCGGNLQDYFITRNRLLFGQRWASWRTKMALFREAVKILFNGRLWQKKGVRDFWLRKFEKGSWK